MFVSFFLKKIKKKTAVWEIVKIFKFLKILNESNPNFFKGTLHILKWLEVFM